MGLTSTAKRGIERVPALARLARRTRNRWSRYGFADAYLRGLHGIEIGGSAHNPFRLNTINVDRDDAMDSVYKREEIAMVGRALPVDVVANGTQLPFEDKSWDFVLASHVIEHFFDPIGALLEWQRVARRFIFLVVPHPDRTFDRGRPPTSLDELQERHRMALAGEGEEELGHRHFSRWTCENFVAMCDAIGLGVVATEDPDRKRGNGFAVVIET